MNSTKITSELTALTKQQSLQCDIGEDNLKKPKTEIKKSKKELRKRHQKIINRNEWQKNVLWIYRLKLEFQTGWFQLPNFDSNFLSSNSGI